MKVLVDSATVPCPLLSSLLPPPSSLLLSLLSPNLQTVNTRTQALRMAQHMSGNMLSRIIKVLLPHRASWRRTIPRLQTCTLYTRRDTDSLVGEVRKEGKGKGGGERVKRERERKKMDASWERELLWRVSGRGILWQVKRRTPFSSLWSCSQDGTCTREVCSTATVQCSLVEMQSENKST